MPNTANPCHRPGPDPIFTRRLVVKVRADQGAALDRIAAALDMTVSDLVRFCITAGVDAIDGGTKVIDAARAIAAEHGGTIQ